MIALTAGPQRGIIRHMPSVAPDGWYPDPDQSATERWWYRGQWSDMTRTTGGVTTTPPPPPKAPAVSGHPSEPTRHTSRLGWLVAFVVLLLVIAVLGVASKLQHSGSNEPPPPTYLHWTSVRPVTVSVTSGGGTSTYTGRSSAGQMQMPAGLVEVSVQDASGNSGVVSCELTSGGQSLSYNSADGTLATATCSN
jgi:hypothetical protein